MGKGILVKLNRSFQEQVFQKLINRYGSSISASKKIGIPASSIRNYKNLHSNLISLEILNILIKESLITKKQLDLNIRESFIKEQIVSKCLDLGREKIKNKFKGFREEIPFPEDIFFESSLNVFVWFKNYLPLLQTLGRKVLISNRKNFFRIVYKNFSKRGYREYSVRLPNKFFLNEDFSYFFGLWCGDRAGGKRMGICNKEEKILEYSEMFLRKHFQKIERILYFGENSNLPKVAYNKKFKIRGGNGWAISVHSINGVLATFFHYLLRNIKFLLNNLNQNAFFAGLFDAEGNVSFYNRSFRWACKDKRLVEIYSSFLKKLNLFSGYDGGCITCYNLDSFYRKIFPYLKHPIKIRNISFLCKGDKKNIPPEFKAILIFIKNNPYKTQKEISKALKKSKVYSELKILKDFGFIFSKDYPLRFKLNKKMKILGV